MSAPTLGEVKTRIVHQVKKNGDTYVLERKTQYDPARKYNIVISSRLIGKIPKGENEVISTRPKRKPGEKASNSTGQTSEICASRMKVGMMDIIDHIGKSSGIDDGIYRNTDLGTAQKILSVARYLFGTNRQTLPAIAVWQLDHPLPYEDGISEDVYHDLFVKVGREESLMQGFFASRLATVKGNAILAYDSTTISTYSEQLPDARYGYNKAQDGLKTVKFLALYSIETRQPVAFAKQPGNQPDVITIENMLKQLQVLGISRAEIVTDNGYYSEKNLGDMLNAHFDFITLVKINVKWVRKELDDRLDEFRSAGSICPFDVNTHGITVRLMHEFTRTRKYGSGKKGLSGGDTEKFSRRIYLHLYFDAQRRVNEDVAFDEELLNLKSRVEKGESEDTLPADARNYFIISKSRGKTTVSYNEKAIAQAKKYHGFFSLVSNKEKNAFECLRKYRGREAVEFFFETEKQEADGTRTRVWSSECLLGRMFVQFVALCYFEYYREQLRLLKQSLTEEIDHPKEGATAGKLRIKKKLLSWLKNTPVYLTLQWFDVVEEVKVSSKLRAKRWTTEITERDKLFLEELGVPKF